MKRIGGSNMKQVTAFVLLLPLLCGCTALSMVFPSSKTYKPVFAEVFDQDQKDKDVVKCHVVADNYKPGIDTGGIVQSGISGASSNAGYGVVYGFGPPAAGAASAMVSTAMDGLGINGANSIKIFVKCLEGYSRIDHAFIISDPHL